MDVKNYVVLGAACIGLFMCFIYVAKLSHMYSRANIDDKLVELEIMTVKCFTVQGEIPAGCYEDFVRSNASVNQEDESGNNIVLFKEHLIKKLREKLPEKLHSNDIN